MSLERQIAIIGAAGMLGHALQEKLPQAVLFDVVASGSIRPIDITNPRSLDEALRCLNAYDVVINAAAYTNVDGAETEQGRELSAKINVQGPKNLARVSVARRLKVIHLSTAYVFDGKGAAYTESTAEWPLNIYGKHKQLGEEPILEAQNVVIRTDMLYGPNGSKNLVDRMVGSVQETGTVIGVTDQRGSPTYTKTLARIIRRIAEKWETNPIGSNIYHATSGNGCTGAELAAEIVNILGQGEVEETTMEALRRRRAAQGYGPMAPRPKDCTLNTEKLRRELGIATPEWKTDLRAYIEEYLK